MGTFSRLNRLMQANLRAVLDREPDPARIIEDTLGELREGLKQAKRDLITAEGGHKRLQAEAEAQELEVTRWDERAALALRSGDEELARDALRQKLAARQEAEARLSQAATAGRAAEQLRQVIAQVEERVTDLEARKGALAAQVRAARAGGVSDSAPGVGRLQALGDRIDALEAEVEAADVIDAPQRQREALEARFRALEAEASGVEVEDDLAALKRRVEEG